MATINKGNFLRLLYPGIKKIAEENAKGVRSIYIDPIENCIVCKINDGRENRLYADELEYAWKQDNYDEIHKLAFKLGQFY